MKLNNLHIIENADFKEVIAHYPQIVQDRLTQIRKIVLETAAETEGIDSLEETLKWGEPSYLVKKGSTIRIDWKSRNPDQYAVYFKCTTRLVETFKRLYGDLFKYQNNRAILFNIEDEIPTNELKHCLSLALTYHRVKHLPMLGA